MYLNFDSKLGKFAKSSRNSEETIYQSVNQKNDMQNIERNEDFNGKSTSFRSSSASQILDEVTDLHRQIGELSQTIIDLRTTIRTKDLQIDNIQRDNERISSELKRQQRCNRNLKQQLDDERFFYEREKEHFSEEMEKFKRKFIDKTKIDKNYKKYNNNYLIDENEKLRNGIIEKNETTYNLCIKFLRMKDSRDSLRIKHDRLIQEHLQVMADMMEKLDEAREELNIIVSEKFQQPLPISKANYLQVVQRNSKLVYENATLKLHIQQLMQNIEKLKSEKQKIKTINVDARTIEKLSECSRRRQSEECNKISTRLSSEMNIEKSSSLSKSINSSNSPIDKKKLSAIKMKNRGKLTIKNSQESPKNTSIEFHTERTKSAPEIIQTSTFRQVQFSEISTNFSSISDQSIEFCDASTNT